MPNVTADAQSESAFRHETTLRRTPIHGVRLVARAAAQARASANEPHSRLPRAYAAMRPRARTTPSPERAIDLVPEYSASLEGPASPPVYQAAASEDRVRGLIKEPSADNVPALEVASPITSVMDTAGKTRSGPLGDVASLHRTAQRALHSRVRSLPPPEPPNPRRLWGLLVSVILIAALAVLLFVIFGP